MFICELCGETEFFAEESSNSLCKSCAGDSEIAQSKNPSLDYKRVDAKASGIKALTGTYKQKKWAEDIRKNYIVKHKNHPEFNTIFNSPTTLSVKFWIENRENTEVYNDLCRIMDLASKINGGDKDSCLSNNYNELSKKLGI